MNESRTPSMYAEWLRDKATKPNFAAYRGDLLSIAHSIDTDRRDLTAALARADKAEAELERLSCAIHHAHKLAAALAQMPTAIEQHEREFLSRARVMDAVVTWRRSNDAAIEQRKKE